MTCTTTPAPDVSGELDDDTREALRKHAELQRAKAAALKPPLAERLRLEAAPLPVLEPEDRNGVEYARWRAATPSTYGFALGAVEERDGRGVHNPFGYPPRGSSPFAAVLARETRQARAAATALWLEAHESATSRVTGKTGG